MQRHKELSRFAQLFNGGAAGHYSLPDDVTELVAAIEHVESQLAAAPTSTNTDTARDEMRRAIYAAALDPDSAPKLPNVSKAEERDREANELRAALRDVIDQFVDELSTTIDDARDAITTQHLQPALAAILAAVPALVDELGGAEWNPAAILDAAPSAHEAYRQLRVLGERYRAIAAAHSALWREVQPQADGDGYLSWSKNGPDVWDPRLRGRSEPPWPTTGGSELLVWAHRNGLELWEPTLAERDALFLQNFPTSPGAKAHAARQMANA